MTPRTVRHWLIDLDDTLYPASSGLFAHVSRRITRRIAEHLGLPLDEARALQKAYWRRYGTSLRGLIVEHGIDPEPFLTYVHDVPIEDVLSPDPELPGILAALPGRRHVFTNGSAEYAQRILERLGVAAMFDRVFDIRHGDYVPKPDPHPFHRVLAALGEDGPAVALVDDAPQNVARARALGMYAVWLRSPRSLAGGTRGNSVEPGGEIGPGAPVIERLADLVSLVTVQGGGGGPVAPGATPA